MIDDNSNDINDFNVNLDGSIQIKKYINIKNLNKSYIFIFNGNPIKHLKNLNKISLILVKVFTATFFLIKR